MKSVRQIYFLFSILISGNLAAVPMYESALTGNIDARSEPEYIAYRKAQQEFSSGNADNASRHYQNALDSNPNFFPALIGLAEISDLANNTERAQAYFDQAFGLAKDSSILNTAYGKFLLKQGKLKEAEQSFEQAIKLNSSNSNAYAELAVIELSMKNDATKAIHYYQKAITYDPGNTSYLYGLSTAQSKAGKLDNAIATLKQITKKLPDNALPWQLIGTYHAQEGQFNDAIKALETSAKLAPKSVDTRWLLAEAYLQSSQPNKALEIYQGMIDQNIQPDTALMKKALIHHTMNQLNDAEKAYKTAIEKNPRLADAYNNLAYITIQTEKNYEQGLRWAQKAAEISPDNPAFLDTLGWLQFKTGDYTNAKNNLVNAANSKPASYDAHYHLAKVYEHLGDAKQAKKHFELAKQMQTGP